MSAKYSVPVILLLFVLLACGVVRAGDDVSDNEDVKSIDVTVNVYKNAGVDTAGAKAAIDEANKILKQAGIRLVFSEERFHTDVTSGDNGKGEGGTAGDGKINGTEFKYLVANGDKEVDNGKKGMKICFADLTAMGTPGASSHKHPTVAVQNQSTAKKTGETIVHEVLHALTLTGTYTIDAETDADKGGHAPNKPGPAGNGNAMAPTPRRNGTAITPDQKGIIDRDGYADKWGKTKKVDTQEPPGTPPATNQQQKGGGCASDLASTPTYLDLGCVSLHSEFGVSTLNGLVAMQDLAPGSDPFTASYYLDFDLNPNRPGYERQIQFDVVRALAGDPVNVSAQVNDLEGGGAVSFFDVFMGEGSLGVDVEDPDPTALESQIEFRVDKALLGMDSLTGVISGQATSYDGGGTLSYTLPIDMDLDWWTKQPDMLLTQATAKPGDLLNFQIVRLTPLTPFELYVDGTLMPGFFTTDINGDYVGALPVPSVAPGDYYIITALDYAGLSAFNAIYVVPEPSTWLLLLLGGLLLIPWRLNKKA